MLAATCTSGIAQPLQNQITEAGRAPAGFLTPAINSNPVEMEVADGKIETDRRIVGISYVDSGGINRICSGLWISRDFVLTAAHCTCNSASGTYKVTNGPEVDKDWRSARFLRRINDAFCVTRQPSYGDDLAILKLDKPLPSDFGVKAKCDFSLLDDIVLGASWFKERPSRIQVAGYGFVGDGAIGERRSAAVGVNTLTCAEPAAQALGCWPLSEFILGAGLTDGAIRDTCAGDSGGPAYLIRNNKFMPIGIVSRGLPIRHPYPNRGICGAGGIYTHLGRRNVIDWLKQAGVPSGLAACPE
jgi:secreted trypsin-like serine protease